MTEADHPVVQIKPGNVRGFWRGEPGTPGASAAFLGLPFAQPPFGELRFAAPVPPEPWDGVLDCLDYGPTPQRKPFGLVTAIPEPSIQGDSTLNVNVFTPRPGEPDAALPVMVWIHGGGYTAGSPASPWYDGLAFNRDGVVTVTVSYRLGFDGFGYIPDAPMNRGVRDWLAALEWVRDNIAAFGGDPARVTIAGQSAGGAAVLTLLGMPTAQDLFQGVWCMSGAVGEVPAERARMLSAKLVELAGVEFTRVGLASIPELKLIDLQEKAAAPESSKPQDVVRSMLQNGLGWAPMIDGDLLTQSVLGSIRAGVGADKPLVLGTMDDEVTMALDEARGRMRLIPSGLVLRQFDVDAATRRAYLAANKAQRRKGTAAVLGRFITDEVFRAPAVRVAHARGSAPTWTYRFAWPSPAKGWAFHCLDVPFWWDCLDSEKVDALAGPNPPQQLADADHSAAVSFVRTGDPGWPSWSAHPGSTRVFDAPSPDGRPVNPQVIPDGYAEVRALA